MKIMRLPKSANDFESKVLASETKPTNWAGLTAGGVLVAGGLLLLTGRRRAGLAAAATGATLALLDQREALSGWWNLLPGYIDEVQILLNQVQSSVEDIATKREKLRKILGK
jgi:hypothetical protein